MQQQDTVLCSRRSHAKAVGNLQQHMRPDDMTDALLIIHDIILCILQHGSKHRYDATDVILLYTSLLSLGSFMFHAIFNLWQISPRILS